MITSRPTDAELLGLVREGDAAAFAELRARHVAAARRLATSYRRAGPPDDLVEGAFEQALAGVALGIGPARAFRTYLFVTLRRLAARHLARSRGDPVDEAPPTMRPPAPVQDEGEGRPAGDPGPDPDPDPGPPETVAAGQQDPVPDPDAPGRRSGHHAQGPGQGTAGPLGAGQGLADRGDDEAPGTSVGPDERGPVLGAYEALPERWQLLMWQSAIEGRQPGELAPTFGMSPNAAAALVYRGREKLRQAYLEAHLDAEPHPECEPHRTRLVAYLRDGLGRAHRAAAEAHIETCPTCPRLLDELRDIDRLLVGAVQPYFLDVS